MDMDMDMDMDDDLIDFGINDGHILPPTKKPLTMLSMNENQDVVRFFYCCRHGNAVAISCKLITTPNDELHFPDCTCDISDGHNCGDIAIHSDGTVWIARVHPKHTMDKMGLSDNWLFKYTPIISNSEKIKQAYKTWMYQFS